MNADDAWDVLIACALIISGLAILRVMWRVARAG